MPRNQFTARLRSTGPYNDPDDELTITSIEFHCADEPPSRGSNPVLNTESGAGRNSANAGILTRTAAESSFKPKRLWKGWNSYSFRSLYSGGSGAEGFHVNT